MSKAEKGTPGSISLALLTIRENSHRRRVRPPRSGNYLLYWMASQALWRVDPKGAKGLDATLPMNWEPARCQPK